MARGEINIVVTPGPGEIVQGQRADTKRPEADRVSVIAGLMGATTQFAIVSEPQTEEERGHRAGVQQALDRVGTPQSATAGLGTVSDAAFKDWQRGYDSGKKLVEELFGKDELTE